MSQANSVLEKWWRAHIADRVRDFRKDLRLSQAELAERLGFKSRVTVAEIEAGRRDVKAVELIALLRLSNRSLDDFWD